MVGIGAHLRRASAHKRPKGSVTQDTLDDERRQEPHELIELTDIGILESWAQGPVYAISTHQLRGPSGARGENRCHCCERSGKGEFTRYCGKVPGPQSGSKPPTGPGRRIGSDLLASGQAPAGAIQDRQDRTQPAIVAPTTQPQFRPHIDQPRLGVNRHLHGHGSTLGRPGPNLDRRRGNFGPPGAAKR